MTSLQTPSTPRRDRARSLRAAALIAVPVVAAVVLAGTWVAGALLTQDAATAKVLTGAWFVLAGAMAAAAAWRYRALAVPVLATWLVVSTATGGFLLVTSTQDRVVDEQVTVAAPADDAPAEEAVDDATDDGAAAGPVAVASGSFRDGAHPTAGTATVIARPDGSRVLTLTGFDTDPGPDLRVYLVPAGAGDGVEGGVDLGGLKGNRGDQEYAVPSGAPTGAVVIWCRAFSVTFGTATLAA